MNTTTTEKLVLTRTFAAPRERVFAAWTQPEQISQWFGPPNAEMLDVQSDIRTGGHYHIQFKSEQYGEMKVYGKYREVTPPSKLVYTWQWADDPAYVNHETLVTVEFIAKGDSTELHLTHENFPTEENRSNHEQGWNCGFDSLEKLLA
ncbi:MAG: SRPBCC domain-containing protein [Chthoniobacterales bacterium]